MTVDINSVHLSDDHVKKKIIGLTFLQLNSQEELYMEDCHFIIIYYD